MTNRAIVALLVLIPAIALGASDYTRISDVIYQKRNGLALTLDVFKPARPNGIGIISIVSGGWLSDHKNISPGPWTDAGYTTFSVVHGSQPRFTAEEIVEQLSRAVRFIRAHAAEYGVDPRKLGVTGRSAGGHLSLMLVTREAPGNPFATDPVERESAAVQAAACFSAPTDYLNWGSEGDVAVGIGPLARFADAFGLQSATAQGRTQLGRVLSPIYSVHSGQAPVFLVHGDVDPQVPLFQAERFLAACRDRGATCELRVRQGAGHAEWREMTTDDAARMIEWFDLQLRGLQPRKPFLFGRSEAPGIPVRATPPPLNTLTAEERAQGWKLLFDGKTTAGWRGYREKEIPKDWVVVDEALTLTKSTPPGERGPEGTGIVTTEEYGDFDLRFEWRIAQGGNSGVMYRVKEELPKPYETGPEYQLVDAKLHPDGKSTPLKWASSCYGMYAPKHDLARPPGDWNMARIVVRGDFVEHWLNGELTVRYARGSQDWNVRLAASKWARSPQYAKPEKGRICFQDHTYTVAFRNVKVFPFPPAQAKP